MLKKCCESLAGSAAVAAAGRAPAFSCDGRCPHAVTLPAAVDWHGRLPSGKNGNPTEEHVLQENIVEVFALIRHVNQLCCRRHMWKYKTHLIGELANYSKDVL